MDTTRLTRFTERAAAALAAGFTTKAAQKECTEFIGRAYDELRSGLHNFHLAERLGEHEALYYSVPMYVHLWKAGHSAAWVAAFPAAAEFTTKIEALATMRAAAMAAPIVKVTSEQRRAAALAGKATRLQYRGNCQCCGSLQAVNGGMAHHGYTVQSRGEGGWFSGACAGHDYAPMQINRKHTDAIVASVRAECIELDALAADLTAGRKTPATAETAKRDSKGRNISVPFANASAFDQSKAIKRAACDAEGRAIAGRRFAGQLESLADKVHGTALVEVTVEA
jgi:hypothetical protein